MPILLQLLVAYLIGAGVGSWVTYIAFGRYDVRNPDYKNTFPPKPYATLTSRKGSMIHEKNCS